VSYDIYREVKLQKSIYQGNAKGIKQLIKALVNNSTNITEKTWII